MRWLKKLFAKKECRQAPLLPSYQIPDEGPFVIAYYEPSCNSIKVFEGYVEDKKTFIKSYDKGRDRMEEMTDVISIPQVGINIDPAKIKMWLAALTQAGAQIGQVKMEGDWN